MISQEFNIEEANEKQQKQKTNSRKKYNIFFKRNTDSNFGSDSVFFGGKILNSEGTDRRHASPPPVLPSHHHHLHQQILLAVTKVFKSINANKNWQRVERPHLL